MPPPDDSPASSEQQWRWCCTAFGVAVCIVEWFSTDLDLNGVGVMATEGYDLRAVVGGATAHELRGVLLALESRVVDVGESLIVPTSKYEGMVWYI